MPQDIMKKQIYPFKYVIECLTEGCGKNDDDQDDGKNDKEAARLISRVLLAPTRTAELDIRTAGVAGNILDILADGVDLGALLVNDMANISEQLIQFANALLYIANLRLAFDDQRLLEVHLALIRKTRPLLLQQLLLLLIGFCFRSSFGAIKCCARSNCRCALLLQSAALNSLEFVQGSFEFGRQLLLCPFLGRLVTSQSVMYPRPTDRIQLDRLTFTSSHPCTFFIPSPTSLKPVREPSRRSWTRSRTRSLSRFVPSSDICVDRREMLEVNVNSWFESVSVRRSNSGSSRYCGSSSRRIDGWCASPSSGWASKVFS